MALVLVSRNLTDEQSRETTRQRMLVGLTIVDCISPVDYQSKLVLYIH